MTDKEQRVKKALCQLLIDKKHSKYAERFRKLYFNIVDSKKHPEFTAAISFDEATVFISDGFLGSGQGIFNQLDVLLRHELAHNLMMHQIRLMHVFKTIHEDDPDEAYEHIRCSSSIHEILNCIEDFEISNKRYSAEDKKIVSTMQLNGKVIGGLITEEHRNWERMSLEEMYNELSQELIQINSDIRSCPDWLPTKNGQAYGEIDLFKYKGAEIIKKYSDYMKPSSIRSPIDILIKSNKFKKFADIYQKIVNSLYDGLKDLTSDQEKQDLLDIAKEIALTDPQEVFDVTHPKTGELICRLYTPEDKMLAADVLKNLGGNINYDPLKFKIKRKTNSQEYKDAWNKVIKTLDTKQFSDEDLTQLRDAIDSM